MVGWFIDWFFDCQIISWYVCSSGILLVLIILDSELKYKQKDVWYIRVLHVIYKFLSVDLFIPDIDECLVDNGGCEDVCTNKIMHVDGIMRECSCTAPGLRVSANKISCVGKYCKGW